MLGCKVTEHMTEYERTVQKTLRSIVAFSAVAVVALLLPFTGVFMPRGESFANWFARAGAPMTIFAIIAQNRVGRLRELLTPNTFSTQEFNKILLKYRRYVNIGNSVSVVMIVVGTIIWAYGDLFWKALCL